MVPAQSTRRILYLVFCIQTLFAQEKKTSFEHISREQGLSQSEVQCIIRDRRGFLWIGTQGGLNRYDGYTFSVYRNSVEDSNSLHDNYVQAIYEDRNAMLWIGTRGALHRFDRTRRQFKRYTHQPTRTHTISNNIISSICEDQTARSGSAPIMASTDSTLRNKNSPATSPRPQCPEY